MTPLMATFKVYSLFKKVAKSVASTNIQFTEMSEHNKWMCYLKCKWITDFIGEDDCVKIVQIQEYDNSYSLCYVIIKTPISSISMCFNPHVQ